jgi:signal transduction histidine kinase
LAIDPEAWYVAQSHAMRLLSTVEASVAQELETIATARLAAAVRGGVMIGAGTTAVLVALAAAMVVVLRTSRRLLYLRQEALAVANGRLPEAITHVANARDPKAVRQAELSAAENTARLLGNGRLDEVGHVAAAFAEVHRQALRQAADQALLRLDVSAILVALSRRGQLLVDRQLRLLDNFERAEADPDTLSRLFAIDHLAARMRRNAENLLVVGGGGPGRTFARPEMVLDVIRAAAAEIEEFRRVLTVDVPDTAVVAPAVGDLVHLLAELMENATTFAAPESPVTVTARRAADGLLIYIYDKGPGMHPDRLAEANRRLSEPDALTGTMGLLVVARLAARHGVTVGLHSAAAEGTAATVRLPANLLVPAATLRSRLAGVRPAPGAGVDAGHEPARLARDPRGGGR